MGLLKEAEKIKKRKIEELKKEKLEEGKEKKKEKEGKEKKIKFDFFKIFKFKKKREEKKEEVKEKKEEEGKERAKKEEKKEIPIKKEVKIDIKKKKKKIMFNIILTVVVLIALIIFIINKKGIKVGVWFWLFVIIILLTTALGIVNMFLGKKIKKKIQEIKEIIIPEIITAKKGYKTEIDDLYELIQQKKKIKFEDVMKKFSIDKKKAEYWAKILEENNLINIHYPAFGEPELELKEKKEEEES